MKDELGIQATECFDCIIQQISQRFHRWGLSYKTSDTGNTDYADLVYDNNAIFQETEKRYVNAHFKDCTKTFHIKLEERGAHCQSELLSSCYFITGILIFVSLSSYFFLFLLLR